MIFGTMRKIGRKCQIILMMWTPRGGGEYDDGGGGLFVTTETMILYLPLSVTAVATQPNETTSILRTWWAMWRLRSMAVEGNRI